MKKRTNVFVGVKDTLALGLIMLYDSLPFLALVSLIFIPAIVR